MCNRGLAIARQTVRISALKCLAQFTTLPEHVILPQQDRVTRHLVSALDDHKRLVRKAAVDTRTKWYGYCSVTCNVRVMSESVHATLIYLLSVPTQIMTCFLGTSCKKWIVMKF